MCKMCFWTFQTRPPASHISSLLHWMVKLHQKKPLSYTVQLHGERFRDCSDYILKWMWSFHQREREREKRTKKERERNGVRETRLRKRQTERETEKTERQTWTLDVSTWLGLVIFFDQLVHPTGQRIHSASLGCFLTNLSASKENLWALDKSLGVWIQGLRNVSATQRMCLITLITSNNLDCLWHSYRVTVTCR